MYISDFKHSVQVRIETDYTVGGRDLIIYLYVTRTHNKAITTEFAITITKYIIINN